MNKCPLAFGGRRLFQNETTFTSYIYFMYPKEISEVVIIYNVGRLAKESYTQHYKQTGR